MTREEAIKALTMERKTALHENKQAFDMAIKALEQEPTTKNNLGVDCISRADARKAIIDHQYSDSFCVEHNIDHSINTGMALIALSDLPPATPQEPRWVLDSERCPEKTGRYLITYYNRYQDTTETQEAFFVEEDDEFKWYDTTEIEITLAVIAWQPLPEPYEPQESEG